jgi:murein L,D-transpeptidase YcbB/YkuD
VQEFKHPRFDQQCSHGLTDLKGVAAHFEFECSRAGTMRYTIRSANTKTFLCALIIALPASALLNATAIYAQAVADDETEGSKSIIQSAIRSFAETHRQADGKSALEAFYAARDYRLAWTGSPEASQRAVKVQAVLRDAEAQGLGAAAYQLGAALTNERAASGANGALYDVALTDALLRYARDVQFGRVRPQDVYRDIELPKRNADDSAALARDLDRGSVESFIAGLVPQHPEYRGLVRALAHYRDIAAAGGWPSVFSTNENDPINRKLLVKRLSTEDRVLAGVPNPSAEQLQAAIIRFQTRNGLKPDGELGPNTMAALNVSVTTRIQQIAANMERWRWMPASFESRYTVINIPDQTLAFVRDGASVMKSRVMVGKKSTRSPILRTEARSVVVNPPWNVPSDIAERQILPKLKTDPNYLAAHNMVVVDGQYKQLPGPNSAMGTLMLDAPNKFDVYLHDTPGKTFFQNDDRELSNGCIRVQDMATLASFVLTDNATAGAGRVNDIIGSRQTRRLMLDDPLPIYMVYWTAIADSNGNVEFRPDRYERDLPLIKALANARGRNTDDS